MQRKYVVLAAMALGVIAADHLTKWWVLSGLTDALDDQPTFAGRLRRYLSEAPPPGLDGLHYRPKRSITVSESFFRLRYAENPGAAFGLFRSLPEKFRAPLFHVVSLGAVVLIAYYVSQLRGLREERWAAWGLPLVLGGALGNYVDRLARGFVVDFLEAHWFDKVAWPSFNVADSAICVGVGLLVIDALVRKENRQPAPAAAEHAP